MDGKRGIFTKEDVQLLRHLVDSLEDLSKTLAESHERNDFERFNRAKKAMIGFQRKISEVIE